MKATATILLTVALSVLAACVPAWSQIPQKLNYQVMLTDDADQPLAEQTVEMVFTIYDAETSGTALWTETQSVTTNSIGVVSVVLGTVNPIDIPFDAPRWLEIEVDSETFSPRRELTSAPFAGRAATAENSDKLGDIDWHEYALLDDLDGPATINAPGNPVVWDALTGVPAGFADGVDDAGAGDGHSLDADDGDPVDVVYVAGDGRTWFRDVVDIGDYNGDGVIRLFEGGNPHVGTLINVDADGGEVRVYDESGNTGALMTADANGTGGLIQVTRNAAGSVGFAVDGNYIGEATRVDIYGPDQHAAFDMSQSGNASVVVPESAVSSYETYDEPGIVSIQADSEIDLNQYSITSVGARTITAPSSGYVFVTATVQLRIYNYDSSADDVRLGISETAGAWSDASQEYRVQLPAGSLDGGWYYFTTSVHGVFQVTSGSHTFYLNAEEMSGGVFIQSRQFTVMYFPTAYGSVDTTD